MEVEVLSRGTINEQYLDDIAVAINTKLGSSSTMTPSEMASKIDSIHTSSEVHLGAGSFSANGSYSAASDNLDGYSTVTISIPFSLLSVSNNGIYTPSQGGYNQVNVNVQPSVSSVVLSSNGTYYASSYNLEGFDEVVVDTPVITLTSLNISNNGIYSAPSGIGYDEVTVNVSGSGDDYDMFDITDPDVIDSLTVTCGDIDSPTGSTSFYQNYTDKRINTLTITSGNFANFNSLVSNPNPILFNKLILDNTVIITSSNSTNYYYSNHLEIKEAVLSCNITNNGVLGNLFQGCSALKRVDMQNAIVASASTGNVLYNCIKDCLSIKEVKLPTNITILGDSFAEKCYSLKNINTDNIKQLGSYVFQNCYSLQKLNLSNLTNLGILSSNNSIFANSGLEEAILPNLTTWSATSTFQNCKNLRKVNLGNSIVSIPNQSFQNCINLKNIIIPDTVTSIGSSAFQGCKALKNIIIPANVTTIGNSAFSNCISLKYIEFLSVTPPTVSGSSTFQNLPTDCIIYVPTGTLNAYTSASNYPSSATYTYIERNS